jgi:hypothetical protein
MAGVGAVTATGHVRRCEHQEQYGSAVKPTQQRHELGQSLWLDNITRGLLQEEEAAAFVQSWNALIESIEARSGALAAGH